ncbi:unnamed protein product [Dracunculus medinensis]|uniref:Aha1_N domain-containing protein n=1 Tax=Dracunculus medinensis TaxID=318479 RepID=A0A0N4U4M5_DRAME|nr:unnamed protein product [Dracunculus medinensis]
MAKWGEGDPRWIVEERPDATNVNNWHWTEKNATPWSKGRLKELLCGQKITKEFVHMRLDNEFKNLTGEATANNRKAKLIFFYEWDIDMGFKVKLAGNDDEYEGRLEIPNLSDEFDSRELEVTISFHANCPRLAEVQQILRTDLVEFVRKQLAIYIRELKEEFSKGLILPTDRKPQVIISENKSIPSTTVKKSDFQSHIVCFFLFNFFIILEPSSLKSLSMTESFKVQPDILWNILTDCSFIKKWTNSDVKIDLQRGGTFYFYSGMVSGKFLEIDPIKEIKMNWRLKSYPGSHHAEVTFLLEDGSDCTNLHIKANGIPPMQYDETEDGFRRFYLLNIGRTFGIDAHMNFF